MVLLIIKLLFYAHTYACTRIRATPVPISVLRPYPYPCYARACTRTCVVYARIDSRTRTYQ